MATSHIEFDVSGTVTVAGTGTPIKGITISYTLNGATGSTSTDDNGHYDIFVLFGTTVSINGVSRAGWGVVEDLPSVHLIEEDTPGVDFTMNAVNTNNYTITGTVTVDSIGTPIRDIKITYTADGTERSVLTNTGGMYTITVPFGTTVKITNVTKTGWNVVQGMPPSSLVEKNISHVDFTMSVNDTTSRIVSGIVTTAVTGTPIKGITILYTVNGVTGDTQTNNNGQYTITVPFGATMKITGVTKAGWIVVEGMPPAALVDENISNINFTMDITSTSYYSLSGKVTDRITGDPIGGVILSYTTDGTPDFTYTNGNGLFTITVPFGTTVVITDIEKDGWKIVQTLPVSFLVDEDILNASFTMNNTTHPLPPDQKEYYITATSDDGSIIIPSGTETVPGGTNKVFHFSAEEGYRISSVKVDGMPLTQNQIDLGYYTFFDVRSNHTIDVRSTLDQGSPLLRIHIAEGKGYAEYSVNGSPFEKYDTEVKIPISADVTVRAHAADGYSFVKWVTPAAVTTPEVTFNGVESSLSLELFFTESSGEGIPIILICAAIIIIAGMAAAIFVIGRRRSGSAPSE